MKKLLALACVASLLCSPVMAQTVTSANLPNALILSLSNGEQRGYQCYDSPRCNLMNLENAQRDGFFIPPGYVKEQPPAVIVKKGGANLESQIMIGVGSAIVVGVAAWLIWGRDGNDHVTHNGGRSALAFKLN